MIRQPGQKPIEILKPKIYSFPGIYSQAGTKAEHCYIDEYLSGSQPCGKPIVSSFSMVGLEVFSLLLFKENFTTSCRSELQKLGVAVHALKLNQGIQTALVKNIFVGEKLKTIAANVDGFLQGWVFCDPSAGAEADRNSKAEDIFCS